MTNVRLDEEDRQLFAATIGRLSERYYSIDRCRSGDMECHADEWAVFAEHGLFGLGIDPEHGGIGGSAGDLALVMGQVGRNLLPLPFMDTVVLGAKIIGTLGSEEQKREMLPAIVKGRLRLSFAHREADAGDVFDYVTTSACSDRLSGMKIHAIDGPSAAAFVVSARDVDCRLRFYLVARDQPGVECQPYRLPDNRMAMRVTLHNTPGVAIGSDASPHIAALCDLAAACLAAEAVGSIASLNRETLEYAKMRRQFGCAIGSFQVIQHRLVDMFIAEQTASAMVTDALMALDAGLPGAGPLVSAAKAQADRAGRFVGESAIQIHGGMGMTDECAVGHYLKRILTIGSQFGTAGWHVARIAENLAA